MKARKKFDQINVIPFIDIMLVLLVMVLTTATFIKQGVIPVALPHASANKNKSVHKTINIYIDKHGSIYINKGLVTLKQLKVSLSSIPKTQTIVLRSDKASTFQDFVNVMNVLKELNLQQLYIATKK